MQRRSASIQQMVIFNKLNKQPARAREREYMLLRGLKQIYVDVGDCVGVSVSSERAGEKSREREEERFCLKSKV